MHQQKISQNTHLQESDTGNGIMPSYPDSSFPQSTVIGEEKSLSEPRADNHILTREIIVFSSRAGQLRVSDTNVTLLYASLPYMLRSSSACMLIAFPWTLIRRECRPLSNLWRSQPAHFFIILGFLARPILRFRAGLNPHHLYIKPSFPSVYSHITN